MDIAKAMAKIASLPEILQAAKVLEQYALLPEGESASDVVKRYVEANPEINEVLALTA